ncbi:MAG: hypothetical protein IPL23_25335 [Saprospiraceae bacterium]|nr:hypothetical protein [Saprospiraceae bacterium]
MERSVKNIDAINIALMAFSFLVARTFPFELFLFSYIVLGPLHYMTEIAWLKERDFFISSKTWISIFILVSMLGVGYTLAVEFLGENQNLQTLFASAYPLLLLGAFTVAAITIQDKLPLWSSLLIISLALVLIFMARLEYLVFLLCLLIPTLIHTTIFTGNFILEGALKKKSNWGMISFFFFILCNVAFFLLPTNPKPLVNPFVQNLFLESNFYNINLNLNYLFYGTDGSTFVLDSALGIRIQGFIAFAYTYHYLNWFSKTNVIKWHQIPKRWLFTSIFIWLASITIHLIDIRLGITLITVLSVLHVYTEFPLNHRSFVNVGSMLWARVSGKAEG